MNIRISNLSYQRNMRIKATESARFLDGADVFTTTDTTVSLIPREGRLIEGTLRLNEDDFVLSLATDLMMQNVIVKTSNGLQKVIPLDQNIAVTWDSRSVGVSAY